MNHVLSDDKFYFLFLIYSKQLSPSSYMTERRGCVMKFRSPDLYTIIIVTKTKKGFLKKKKRVNGLFIFMTMTSFKQVESNYRRKDPYERGCGWIVTFFWIVSWTNFDTFLRIVNFILIFFREESDSFLSVGKLFFNNLKG